MIEINGTTRVLLILAEPVAHVRTPQAINALAASRRANCVMVPCEVAPTHLELVVSAMRAMRSVGGAVVTAPHKCAAARLCDDLSEQSARSGVVNAIRRADSGRLSGDTFDGKGFVAGLAASGIQVANEDVFLVGAGGAASSIAYALAASGVRRLVIRNRTTARAQSLALLISESFPLTEVVVGSDDPAGCGLVINASMLGMRDDDPLPLDPDRLVPDMTVADVVMQPERTRLLLEAERRGCRVQPGTRMLQHQLAMIAEFLGISATT